MSLSNIDWLKKPRAFHFIHCLFVIHVGMELQQFNDFFYSLKPEKEDHSP